MSNQINFESLINSIGDGVITSNAKGIIIFWNKAAENIFGFTKDEALGQSLDLIIPDRLRQRHNEGYDQSMKTGLTRYGNKLLTVPALHKLGQPLSIAFTVAMLFDDTHQVSSITAVVRDDTERFQLERSLKRRILDLEELKN